MKKIVSVLLATIMLTLCLGTTGFAADVSFNDATMEDIIDLLDRNMPLTQAQRVEVFNLFALYAQTSDNISSLITTLETVTGTGSTVSGTLNDETFNNIIANVGDSLAANKDEIKFILSVFKALPNSERQNAIADFRAAQDAVEQASILNGAWVTEAEADVLVNEDAAFQEALCDVYDYFVHNDGDEPGDSQLGTHGVGPNTILRLFKSFQGSIELTDAAVGSDEFAVKTVSDEFKNNLYTYVSEHFDTINGEAIADGDVILDAMVAGLNNLGDYYLKVDVKTVLGADEIALYTPLVEEGGDDGGDDGDDDGGSTGSRPSSRPGSSSKPDITQQIGKLEPSDTEVSAPPVADAAYVYTDTEDHWAKDYIAELSERDIFNGYEDGSFRPDMGITREEIAVAMTRALGLETKAKRAPYANFSDSSYISEWATDAVNMMVKVGIFTGYDDGLYRPQQIITREQLVAVVMRMFSDDIDRATLGYQDKNDIGEWSKAYVKQATELGIVGGYPDGTFRPVNSITRAEAAKILYTFMHYAGLL